MELLSKLERMVQGWLKNVPHLPEVARTWISNNVWWMALIAAILSGVSVLVYLFALLLGSAVDAYVLRGFAAWQIVLNIVGLAFAVLDVFLLASAIKPLQLKQKKGWVLLFATWLLSAVYIVANAVLSLNAFVFITNIIFGAVGLAIGAYFLFEIHSKFAHTEKSKGVKAAKS